jgi:hypothetical protein
MNPQELDARIRNDFAYHKPSGEDTALAHERVREACRDAAEMLLSLVPAGREL